ncbi:DUF3099 domain-containing protein [Brevibacterium sp. BDJS002]|uniref:DUF3099 domain-containing protein n=1 Tax=Brevibacterium sp. BDJS002 TaxID=3020906 RepID=UPI0023081156|nr:DUF3099 domain-containing protein [Brevibacterium sp. BDJS002]MDN5773306.1 DUF3099 domain-containing protein [Brevibacterium aurantiacum]WCE38526.1 DUF3099 domain-containing protein [Brevibacterium sp. BDJS002]
MSKHPQQITTADTALDDDMKSRIIKYSITMAIRTFCFVAAYFMFRADLTVLMWICVAGAVLLPYPAVIFANAGRERSSNADTALIDNAPMPELPPATGDTVSGETISGDTISGESDDAASADDTDGSAHPTDPTRGDEA